MKYVHTKYKPETNHSEIVPNGWFLFLYTDFMNNNNY